MEQGTKALDYLVTFFIEDRITTRLLSEVVNNRDNAAYIRGLGLPKGFVLPFFLEESRDNLAYKVQIMDSTNYNLTCMGKPCNEKAIHDGDYISFKTHGEEITVKVLFIAISNFKIGYKKYALPKNSKCFIGRSIDNEITYSFSELVSREHHLAITTDVNGRAFIEDLKGSIGLYVNGKQIQAKELELFDEIFLMGLSMVYLGEYIAVRNLCIESKLQEVNDFLPKMYINNKEEKTYFVRTPRILKSLDNDLVEVDAPPNKQRMEELPLYLTIGPSLTMSMVMLASLSVSLASAIEGGNKARMIASGAMAAGMLLGALLWPTLLRKYQKKKQDKEEEYRKKRYSSYIADIEDDLIAKTERSVRLMKDVLNPSPKDLCASFDNETNKLRLWERSIGEQDFLDVRLGLGTRPFSVNIKIPKQGFKLYEDELLELPPKLLEKYGTLNDVPLALDLYTNRAVGLIGDSKNIENIINEIVLNIISLHSYDEVKLVFVSEPSEAHLFERFKNLPHTWSNDKKVRYFANNIDEVHYIFSSIDDIVQEREGNKEGIISVPHFVFIIREQSLIERESLQRYMQNPYNNVGITTIFAYGDITKLPKSCTTIIQSDAEKSGYYIRNQNQNRFIPFVPDTVDEVQLDAFATNLTNLPVKRDARTLGIVDRISFLQMYRVGNVDGLCIEQRWDNNNSAKTLAAPIGVMAGGQVFSLDLHESFHGCHGLVAGTTGSGKSEFLQAFVLSLAINYSPKEIAFVLVDFKGGDMARPFMTKSTSPALPHLSATISNLSGNVLYRALISLEAEIKSRQRIFNESAAFLGVDKLDINSYHKYYKGGKLKNPLPHLVIIIDEFAQLKTQQPEFLAQLINVAQVGRSLGIHLILATQKPSGIVDPQIMSNSRFKVCLKVAEKQDSMDMINRPDSAMIKNPGRMNLLVGYNEIFETIQSGFSGADYVPLTRFIPDEEITVQLIDNAANPIHSAKLNLAGEKTGKTQLEAVVAEIVKLGQKRNVKVKPLWLDMLKEVISIDELKLATKGLCTATIGMLDCVRLQEQKPLTINFTERGHIGVYGASGTGKTTFMQSLIYSMICSYKYTPEELNIYAMDFGGRNLGYLNNLPHTGGVVFAGDDAKISNFVSTLQGIVDERKHIFATHNCGTFTEYRELGKKLPAIIVLIDNYASFRDKYMDESERMLEVIASGKTYGVYFVITSSTRNGIHYKVVEYISAFYALRMNDASHYLDILNTRPPIIPENICGRGITLVDKDVVEFQIALASEGENEAERLTSIVDKYMLIKNGWTGTLPIQVEDEDFVENINQDSNIENSLSISPSVSRKQVQPNPVEGDASTIVLAASKSGALKFGYNLEERFKTAVLANNLGDLRIYYQKIIASISEEYDRRIVVLDDENRSFEEITANYKNCAYLATREEIDDFFEKLKPELNARLDGTNKCEEKLFIIIPEFNSFFNMISDEQAGFMRKVIKYINNPKYGLHFFVGYNVESDKLNDTLFVMLIVNAENYIMCPGAYSIAANKLEKLPVIYDMKNRSAYFTTQEGAAEIRW